VPLSFWHAGSTVATFVPAQCVGRDCEPSLRAIREGVPLLDLQLFKCSRCLGAEIKRLGAPLLTGSMCIALANLQLAHLPVVYVGGQSL